MGWFLDQTGSHWYVPIPSLLVEKTKRSSFNFFQDMV